MSIRNLKSSLTRKGFKLIQGAKHEKYHFIGLDGKKIGVRTSMSRGASGRDLSKSMESMIAKQMGLTKTQFRDFVSCELSQEKYGLLVSARTRD